MSKDAKAEVALMAIVLVEFFLVLYRLGFI